MRNFLSKSLNKLTTLILVSIILLSSFSSVFANPENDDMPIERSYEICYYIELL